MRLFFIALIAAILVAGPISSPVLADTTTGPTCQNTYIVRRGDSLGKIARTCNITLNDLLAANPEVTNTGIIYPGQIIRIVAGSRIPDTGGSYTVKSGDTLSTVAERFDTTVKELLRMNPDILDPRFIFIGQVLQLPGKTTGPRISLLSDSVVSGGQLQVEVYGFPANTPIDFRARPIGGTYTVIKDGETNENGYATATIVFPSNADSDHPWEIEALTTGIRDGVQATSASISITY